MLSVTQGRKTENCGFTAGICGKTNIFLCHGRFLVVLDFRCVCFPIMLCRFEDEHDLRNTSVVLFCTLWSIFFSFKMSFFPLSFSAMLNLDFDSFNETKVSILSFGSKLSLRGLTNNTSHYIEIHKKINGLIIRLFKRF